MSSFYKVILMPIEPILFSDNRSARAGADHLIRDQDPSPHTIYGAIGGYIAKQLQATINSKNWQLAEPYLGKFNSSIENDGNDRAELLGYCLMDSSNKLWFPKPKHFFLTKNKAWESYPNIAEQSNPSSLSDVSHLVEHEPIEEELEAEVYVELALLGKILLWESQKNKKLDDLVRDTKMLYQLEPRLGIGMDNNKNSTKEGLFFSRPYRRFMSELNRNTNKWQSVGFTSWYKTRKDLNGQLSDKGLCFLGGDRRRAVIEFEDMPNDKPLLDLSSAVQDQISGTQGFFAYLLTPAVREDSWPIIEKQPPIAACIGKEMTISGWNSDRSNQHPRPILKLIPAGSSFFYKWQNGDDEQRKKIIHDNWFKPVSEKYKNSGFGRILIGVWK